MAAHAKVARNDFVNGLCLFSGDLCSIMLLGSGMNSAPPNIRNSRNWELITNRLRKFKFLAVLVTIVALASFLGVWFSSKASDPRLSVTYIRTIKGAGHWKIEFGITNVGARTIFTSQFGKIEVFNHTNLLSVGATSPMSKLAPGEGQVIKAVLSDTKMDLIDGKWRYTCLYAKDGFRSRIYSWQWGPSGPGTSVNWLIPRKLKGMPLNVKATSDWIAPVGGASP